MCYPFFYGNWPTTCAAQNRLFQTEAEVGGFVASENVIPIWLRADQFGSVPNSAPTGTLRLRLWKDYAPADTARKRRLDYGFGVNPVANIGAINQFLLVEAYAKVKWRGVELMAGCRRDITGLGDSVLSSGFYSGSGNALPIPKVLLQTASYQPVPFLSRFISFNAGMAHGWYQADYIKGVFLHQKHLYLRFGKPLGRVHAYAGVNHQALWGGRADYLREPPTSAPSGKLPSSLRDFPYVFSATAPGNWVQQGYTAFDSYRIGNHLGSIDFGFSWSGKGGNLLFYHQHPFEDVSGLLFLNAPDGLWGLRWVRATQSDLTGFRLNRLTMEVLSTTNQSGPTFYITSSRYQGADNYFNHGQYLQGWSYRGNAVGTPLIPTRNEVQPALQQQSPFYFPSNRVQNAYVGAEGQWRDRLTLTTRVSFGRYYGTFFQPFDKAVNQFSALLMAQTTLPRWNNLGVTAGLALDQGGLLPRSAGGYIGLRKRWN
ncbi:MAG: capsule assembly Wzi family protein [Rudanella sp.]|nr:capsule assembly Wzi family protein [Rudanella sp.]